MLVLTRKELEAIRITHAGESMRVIVYQVRRKGFGVRLALDAPDSFHIVRDELRQEDGSSKAGAGPDNGDGSRMEGRGPSPDSTHGG